MNPGSSTSATNAANSNVDERPLFSFFNYGTPSAFIARNIYPTTTPIDLSTNTAGDAYQDEESVSSDYCSFCLQAYTLSGEQKVRLEKCKHTFGKSCVAEYFLPNRAVNRCPICNDEVFDAPDFPEPFEHTLSEVVIRHCYRTFRAQLNRKIYIDIDAYGLSNFVNNALHASTDWAKFWDYVQETVEETLFEQQNKVMTLFQILRLIFESVEHIMFGDDEPVERQQYWASILPNLHTLVSRPHLLEQHLQDPDMKWLVKTANAYTYAVEATSRLATEQDEIDIREAEERERSEDQEDNRNPDEYWSAVAVFVQALLDAAERGEVLLSEAFLAAEDMSGAARALRAFNNAISIEEGSRRVMEEFEWAFARGEAPPSANIFLAAMRGNEGEMDVDMLLDDSADEEGEEDDEDDMDL